MNTESRHFWFDRAVSSAYMGQFKCHHSDQWTLTIDYTTVQQRFTSHDGNSG